MILACKMKEQSMDFLQIFCIWKNFLQSLWNSDKVWLTLIKEFESRFITWRCAGDLLLPVRLHGPGGCPAQLGILHGRPKPAEEVIEAVLFWFVTAAALIKHAWASFDSWLKGLWMYKIWFAKGRLASRAPRKTGIARCATSGSQTGRIIVPFAIAASWTWTTTVPGSTTALGFTTASSSCSSWSAFKVSRVRTRLNNIE